MYISQIQFLISWIEFMISWIHFMISLIQSWIRIRDIMNSLHDIINSFRDITSVSGGHLVTCSTLLSGKLWLTSADMTVFTSCTTGCSITYMSRSATSDFSTCWSCCCRSACDGALHSCKHTCSSRIRVFYVSPKSKNATFSLRFWSVMSKNVKNRKRYPSFLSFQSTAVFTLLHFEIAKWQFRCKTITHVILYIQHCIKIVYFWLKYKYYLLGNWVKDNNTDRCGHCSLQAYRTKCYTSTFFAFFTVFQNPKKDMTFSSVLADRTNGRAIATLLRLSSSSSVCLWRYVLWLNGAS